MCWVCFDSSPHVFVNLIVSPPSLFRCSLANLVPHLVLIIYDYLPFITPCVFLSVVRCQTVVVFSACTDCITHLSFVLSGSSARSCFCVSLHPSLCVQLPWSSTATPAIPLAADALRTAQPLARICEQPRQLHCFCRCYGSSRRGDLTICVSEDSVHL